MKTSYRVIIKSDKNIQVFYKVKKGDLTQLGKTYEFKSIISWKK